MIIVIVLIILCILFAFYKDYIYKFKFINVKMSNIEEKINSTLIKRKELIKDSEEVIKEIIKTKKDIYEGINNLNEEKLNMIELDRKLLNYINEFFLIENRYKRLKENENFEKIYFAINETEDLLIAYKDYYNDTADEYNKLIRKFPIVIVAKLKGKKEKLFFDKKLNSDI